MLLIRRPLLLCRPGQASLFMVRSIHYSSPDISGPLSPAAGVSAPSPSSAAPSSLPAPPSAGGVGGNLVYHARSLRITYKSNLASSNPLSPLSALAKRRSSWYQSTCSRVQRQGRIQGRPRSFWIATVQLEDQGPKRRHQWHHIPRATHDRPSSGCTSSGLAK